MLDEHVYSILSQDHWEIPLNLRATAWKGCPEQAVWRLLHINFDKISSYSEL